MRTFLNGLIFGLAAFFLAGFLSQSERHATGRFGDADAFTRAWFVNAPLSGLVGFALGLLYPGRRRKPPPPGD